LTCACVSQGVLAGFDQKSNVILSDCTERVYSMDEGVEVVELGVYLLKGDMMCVTLTHSASATFTHLPFSPAY
jgi:small nuclear ribonucleoprotein (snRNP)-like protein